ncbi:MAG: FkbM family methyltransferase [Rhodospirillaceae bacterium]|nr:FkbM family methyltransferase [Rhodospirillaceae bacterium]
MAIDQLNTAALAKRATLPAANDLSADELYALPYFFGWVECDCGPCKFTMFLGGGDDAIALRFFWNGSYEKTTLKAWATLARKVDLALDIGAHTGVYTLAAMLANPGMPVGAFEPNPANYSRLGLNLRLNNLQTGNLFMVAAGARNETLPFSAPAGSLRFSSAGAIGARSGMVTIQTQVVTLDSYLPAAFRPKVGLVKIDTEGYEGQCIEGMTEIISTAHPIIFFECVYAHAGAAVEKKLAEHGYSFFEVDDDQGTITPVAAVRPHLHPSGEPIFSRINRIALPGGRSIADILG